MGLVGGGKWVRVFRWGRWAGQVGGAGEWARWVGQVGGGRWVW